MSQFWTKYIVRVAKITSLIALCHKTFNDYSAGTVSNDNALFYTIMGIITITTGFINTFLLKPKRMGQKRKLWVGYHHIKLLITLLLYLPFAKWWIPGSTLASIRMYWVLSTFVISPYMRFYRQANTPAVQAQKQG